MSGATENLDGSRKRWVHGATIVKGEVQFASVSSLELGQRCLRRWAFRYGPHKLQDEETDATRRGNASHAEVAKYLATGSRAHLSPVVVHGLHQIPTPGDDLFVEYPFVPDLPGGKSGKAFALLRADGIPIIGAMDLMHARPENYGVQDITDSRDEPGVIKLVDWKFPGNVKNIKEGHELIDTLQMNGYAQWGFLRFPEVQKIRISHCYFPMRGQPRHTTALVTREESADAWKRADAIGVSLRYAAREPDPNRVDSNTNDCEAYGKPCPARVAGVCTAHSVASVSSYVGQGQAERLIAAASLVRPPQPQVPQPMTQPTAPVPTSIFAAYGQAPAAPQSATCPAAPAQYAPAPAPPQYPQYPPSTQPPQYTNVAPCPAPTLLPPPSVVPPTHTSQGFTDQLAAEMARLQANVAAPAPVAPAPPALTPEQIQLDQLCKAIEMCGMGFPAVVGELAKAYALMKIAQGQTQYDPNAPGYSGTGTLAGYNIPTVDALFTVLKSVQDLRAQQVNAAGNAAGVSSPLPPDMPPTPAAGVMTSPAPAAAALPVAPATPAPAALPTAPPGPSPEELKASKEAEKAAKKAAKAAAKAAADAAAAQAQVQPLPPATAAPVENVTVQNIVVQAPAAPAPLITPPVIQAYATTAPPVAAAPSSTAVNFFVDTVVEGVALQPLWPIVDAIWAAMAQDSAAGSDPRMARDPQNKYSHGGWKGILAATLRDAFLVGTRVTGKLPGGSYTFDGSFGEIGSVVVEAIREVARGSGGAFVKGAR